MVNPFYVGQLVEYENRIYTIAESTPDYVVLEDDEIYRHIGVDTDSFQKIKIA